MIINQCNLEGILLIKPEPHSDERGLFLEIFEEKKYKEIGVYEEFVQDNFSRSRKNVLRGLHFTKNKHQAQIVTVISGIIFDVVVDIRKESPTFGQWFGAELSDEGTRQIYMPHGFAHGFCVLSACADLHYKVSQHYDPADDCGLIWNDDYVKIDWPLKNPIISLKDQSHKKWQEL